MAYITAPDFRMKGIEWELDRPSQVNVSAYTARRSVLQNPWHGRWRAKVELATLQGESDFRTIRSFFARCEGQVNVFRLYATTEAQNANFGVTVASTAAAGATTMSISGYTTALTEGQYFTVNGQLCVCIANQSGASLTFEPPLRAQATAGTIVVTARPYALVHMAVSSTGWSVGAARRYGAGFIVEEAIGDAEGTAPESPADFFAAGESGVWYDPSDLASMFQDSAGTIAAAVDSPVGRINDKSGNGKHATQATSASRPMLRSSGGLYWLEFDGVDDYLDVPAVKASVSDWTMVSRHKLTSTTGYRYVLDSATGRLVFAAVENGLNLAYYDGAFKGGAHATTAIETVTWVCTNGSGKVRAAGSDVATGQTYTQRAISGTTRLGCNSGAVTDQFVGEFHGCILVDRVLSAAELANAENWLSQK